MKKDLIDKRYAPRGLLGAGGMAKVYLAHDELLGRDVALKVLREHYAGDEGFVERFEREAKAAASLSHPNVVQIYDRGCSDDVRYYIVMEYVPGGTLKERVKAEGPLGHAEAAGLAVQIAGALGAAHAGGVVHRDVKPQNVLLAEDGGAKVADFGIARAASAASISRTDLIVGTPNYMSPEQAKGGSVGPRSDLYSLGVVLYEMLTGRVPFEAETPLAVCTMHVDEPAPSPREANPGVSEALDAITLRLLSKDPAERHASAEELIEDLRRAAEGAAGIARGGEPTLPLPRRAAGGRRRRKAPLALASLAVLGGLLGGGYLWQGSEGPGVAGFLRGVPEEARRALGDAGRAVGSIGVAQAAEVPDVVGLSAEEAEERLAEAGFESERRPRESSEEDLGKVLEQSVRWGEEAEEGSTILLAVGAGPQDEEGAGPAPSYDEEQYYAEPAYDEEQYQGEPSYDEGQPAPAAQEPAQYEEPVAPAPEPAPAEAPVPAPAPLPVAQQPTPAPAPVAELDPAEQPAPAPEVPYYEEPVYYDEPGSTAPEPAPAPEPEERQYYEEPADPAPAAPAPEPEQYYEEPGYREDASYEEPYPEDGGGDSYGEDQYDGGDY